MYAYCANNPVMMADASGWAGKSSAGVAKPYEGITKSLQTNMLYIAKNGIDKIGETKGKGDSTTIRDVTYEIDTALAQAVSEIHYPRDLVVFYGLVNHGAPWDIKRRDCWFTTIGSPYPGFGVNVYYHGLLMTPEELGNFTYGYLGAAYGFSIQTLIAGSYYAAGFPTEGEELENEQGDWLFIQLGYKVYLSGFEGKHI